ncbi:hypothetical protein HK097_005809 [Rhizophlyctis rosea]|uniref:Uncharacterized protein n=1 Tax=Rhizophlyctis rosea TaxID=64517 RepID=A0AAD5SES7_9FUNG|nr:hypothetical protein HK097_005809 [Rhizophlyctis rosea]
MIREQIQAQEHKECLDCQNWQLKYEGLERQMETLKTERDQLQKQIQQDEATLERDQSIKTNKQLVERGSILEKKVRDLEKRGAEWKIEKDKDARWRRGLEGVVKDWKVCLKELNLTAAVGDDPSPEFLVGLETILSTQILKLKREMEDLKRALHDSRKVHTTLEREHTACLQRYILEMEKKEAQSTVAKEHLAELIETAERSRRDREKALEEVRHITRDKTMVEDGLRRVLRQKEEEIVDLTMKSNEQIKSLREQYDNDRMRLQQKVDELSNSKVELQVEIGRLMRDKRAAEFELDSVTKGIEAKRRDFVLDLSLGAGKSDGGISVYGR